MRRCMVSCLVVAVAVVAMSLPHLSLSQDVTQPDDWEEMVAADSEGVVKTPFEAAEEDEEAADEDEEAADEDDGQTEDENEPA